MSRLAKLFGLNAKEQDALDSTVGTMRSISEFVCDLHDATKDFDTLIAVVKDSPWWLQAVGASLAEAAPPIKFITTLLGKLTEERDADRLAFLAATIAYQRCVGLAIRVQSVGTPDKSKRSQLSVKHEQASLGQGKNFEDFSWETAASHWFVQESNDLLCQSLYASGFSQPQVAKVQNEVNARFGTQFWAILTAPSTRERFAAVRDRFSRSGSNQADLALRAHRAYVRAMFEEHQVFGDEPFALRDVYTPTECGVLTGDNVRARHAGTEPKDPFREDVGGRHDALTCVVDLIKNPKFHDAIVLQGVAGSGKSSFTLALADRLMSEGFLPVRVRFRDLNVRDVDIVELISEGIRFHSPAHDGNEPAPASPAQLKAFLTEQFGAARYGGTAINAYVIILDGWDEVSVSVDRGYAIRIKQMLDEIRREFIDKTAGPRVRFVITGRPSNAVNDAMFIKNETRVLTLRPLSPEALDKFLPRLAARIAPTSNALARKPGRYDGLLKDYRKDFAVWAKNGVWRGPTEVLGQPLLTHLAARLMVRWKGDDLHALIKNPTTLYRNLADLTCNNAAKQEDSKPGGLPIEEFDLRRLLRATAVAMTTRGEDTMSFAELAQRLDQLDPELWTRVTSMITPANRTAASDRQQDALSALMVNFFFKSGNHDLGAEFVHKSFREYLFAEAIVERLKQYGLSVTKAWPEKPAEKYWQDFESNDPRSALARDLARYFAPQWITPEAATFLETLYEWEVERTRSLVPDEDGQAALSEVVGESMDGAERTQEVASMNTWAFIRDALADLWDWWGEGVHLRDQPIFRGDKVKEWAPALVNELAEWCRLRDGTNAFTDPSPRTTTIDSHLGDGLFRLCALAHYHASYSKRWPLGIAREEPSASVRRYQSRRSFESGSGVVEAICFRPSGGLGGSRIEGWFNEYADRINASGWRRGNFPSRTFARMLDLSHAYLEGLFWTDADLASSIFEQGLVGVAYFALTDLRATTWRDTKCFMTTWWECPSDQAHMNTVFTGSFPSFVCSPREEKLGALMLEIHPLAQTAIIYTGDTELEVKAALGLQRRSKQQ